MTSAATPSLRRELVVDAALNPSLSLPYSLRIDDFRSAMQAVYDFFYDVDR